MTAVAPDDLLQFVAQRYEEAVPLDRLHPWPGNPRYHDQDRIAESISHNGFVGAVLAQESTGRIIEGHGRTEGVVAAGGTAVPVLWLDVDDDTGARLLVALNPGPQDPGSDPKALLNHLRLLAESPGGLLGSTYTADHLESLLTHHVTEEGEATDSSLLALADVSYGDPDITVEVGEVWRLDDRHTLVCADLITEHATWGEYLRAHDLFCPYPSVVVPLSDRAARETILLLQPDPYLAGHLLSKYAAVHGPNAVYRETP